MQRFMHCAAICALFFAPFTARSAIIINEVVYDDGGTDDREFIELHNNGVASVDISGWIVRNSDEVAPPGDNNGDFTIPAATSIAAGGYYVLGHPGVLNVNQTYAVTSPPTLENGREGMELLDAGGAVQDTFIYETSDGPVAVTGEGSYYGQMANTDLAGTPLNTAVSIARYIDGRDTNNNGRDFGMRPSTPGTSNQAAGTMTFYNPPNPVGQSVGAVVPGLTGSFVGGRFIDPTVADTNNPNVIPPAPITGNRAIVAWDNTGGGNGVTSNQVFGTSQGGFKIFAYLDTSDNPQSTNATNVPFLGSEVTIYGIGGADFNGTSVRNLTDLAGNTGLAAQTLPLAESINGTTGVAWVYERTSINGTTGATQVLYLVDANDGGDSDVGGNTPLDWTILQTIDISGLASGWFDLGISIDALGNGVATFNNSLFGFTTSTSLHSGAFNVAYRENVQAGADATPDAQMRPATFTIPEPGSLMLVALGLVSLGTWRRR
jgi:Lamin Tail Domain/PEP-CTERM motif